MQNSDNSCTKRPVKQKVTIRLDPVLVSYIETLCQSGRYRNRTAFIEQSCHHTMEKIGQTLE